MMSDKNRSLLEKKCPVLMEAVDLQSSNLFAVLRSKGAITTAQIEFIRHKEGNSKQVETLVETLLRKTDEIVDTFVGALEESGHSDVAKELRQSCEEAASNTSHRAISGQQGPTAQELQQALRRNIEQYLKTDPSRILEEAESIAYVQQSVTVQKIDGEKEPDKMPVGNISELLETCNSPGQRVFVYGTAGMGKSSLCRNIAQIWARGQSKLSEQYDYVFPIPMRSVRSHSLIDIICRDVRLIPESCKQRIEQELELKPILFVLDSFEELSHMTLELNQLIRRELFPNSSVLVTARPGHQLEDEEEKSKPCLRADLGSLSEKQVKDYIATYPGLQKDVQLQIEEQFGMSFLSRPINIWLVCLLLAQTPSSVGMPDTQTVLLNMIVQHLMLAYSKKRKLSSLNLTPESPYKKRQVSAVTLESPMNNAPTEVKVMLEKVGQLCYFGLRDKKRVLVIDDGVLSKPDVLAMGLFSEGADDNSVTLPHPLFQEYLAALFLSVDRRARQELLKELREESEGYSPRPPLVLLLHPHGLDNMVRFLVGLSGVPERLTDLFCFWHNVVLVQHEHISDFAYELDLFEECMAEEEKSQIASALLKAPVLDSNVSFRDVTSIYSHLLLHHFDEEQRHVFLRKFYGYEICSHELIQAQDRTNCRLDNFVVGMIYLYNCTVRLKKVNILGCHVPVSMLTDRLAAVEGLGVVKSTLCDLTESQFLASLNLTSLSHSLTPEGLGQSEVSPNCLELQDVRGLSLLSPQHVKLPATHKLEVYNCGDINLGSLRQCFTAVSELTLNPIKNVYNYDGQWLSVSKLEGYDCDGVNLRSLRQCFTGVSDLTLGSSELVFNFDGQWSSVCKLQVLNCEGVNLGSLCQCFTGVSELELGYNKRVYNYDSQWPSVSKLELSSCEDINLGSLCQCFTGVSDLTLSTDNLVFNFDGLWPSVSKLRLLSCEDLGSLCQCFTGVSDLTLSTDKLVFNFDGQWPSVSKLEVFFHEDLGLLRQCFTGVRELQLNFNKHLYNYDGQWSSVRKLHVGWSGVKSDLLSLKDMFVQLEELEFYRSRLQIEKAVPDRQTQWQTLKSLGLIGSVLHIDEKTLSEEEARESLTQFCPQAEVVIEFYGSIPDLT